jgi:hypothetical protein
MSDTTHNNGGDSNSHIVEWDDQYDNPDSKIILISSDNVGFRVDPWLLKKKR